MIEIVLGDLAPDAPHDLARARFRQGRSQTDMVGRCNGSDLGTDLQLERGDELHTDAGFRQSYNLGTAVTALGASTFRYLRISGTATGNFEGTNGFDLGGLGFRNFTSTQVGTIPEPST